MLRPECLCNEDHPVSDEKWTRMDGTLQLDSTEIDHVNEQNNNQRKNLERRITSKETNELTAIDVPGSTQEAKKSGSSELACIDTEEIDHGTTQVIVNNNKNKLIAFYQNVRGLRTKTNKCYLNAFECEFDWIALTETNLTSKIESVELFDPSQFVVYRRDRSALNSQKKSFGGVLIAVRSSFESEILEISHTDGIECVCVKSCVEGRLCYVYCRYIPPDKHQDFETYDLHVSAIGFVVSHSSLADLVFVCADLNLPYVKWTEDDENPGVMIPGNVNTEIERRVCDGIIGNGLYQINTKPNANGRYLDLVFASTGDDVFAVRSDSPLVEEDIPQHFGMEFHVDIFSHDEPCVRDGR